MSVVLFASPVSARELTALEQGYIQGCENWGITKAAEIFGSSLEHNSLGEAGIFLDSLDKNTKIIANKVQETISVLCFELVIQGELKHLSNCAGSPSGRVWTSKQVRLYYYKGGFEKRV
jgi:hypothetical protein